MLEHWGASSEEHITSLQLKSFSVAARVEVEGAVLQPLCSAALLVASVLQPAVALQFVGTSNV